MNPETANIRTNVLIWLYDRAQISQLPHSEAAIRNGLRREGTEASAADIREALDFFNDKQAVTFVKSPVSGKREDGAWRITAAGKELRESF